MPLGTSIRLTDPIIVFAFFISSFSRFSPSMLPSTSISHHSPHFSPSSLGPAFPFALLYCGST
ncbi:Protein of unknown function [Pyronema omphalodes CBS 100304]|uniref:Uncharacterized protein n=1 Tax=Pyronema omphalodes (strain CBS 100304) TaxID=1076935 RepID=U4KWI8_PYROM|nr:Protein of unknown function [Pyronema omphalodes CBS 100304]